MTQQKQSVFITAVSGSGKTTTCKALQELGFTAYDIENIDGLFAWKDDVTGKDMGKYHDDVAFAKQASWICDKDKLKEVINRESSSLAFYCGAGSNIDELWDLFDKVIILQVSDETTVERLRTRKSHEYGHTPEVREYVLSWKTDVENEWITKGGIPVCAEDSPRDVAQRVIGISRKKKFKP